MVPADERADPPRAGVEGLEAEVARCEVELLVEERVAGDVHLAVEPDHLPGGVEDGRAVVVQPGRAALEHRVLLLAEVGRAEELGQAHDLGAASATRDTALRRFSRESGAIAIWTSPTLKREGAI